MAQWLTSPTRNHEVSSSIPGLAHKSVALSYGVGRRCGLDPELLWLWHRLAATAPIRPLAWEPPCAKDEALEKVKRQKKQKQKQTTTTKTPATDNICL